MRWGVEEELKWSWGGDEKGGSVSVLVLVFIYIYYIYYILHAMQTNTFMYPSINTKVWSELCYCCADAVFILEYIANTSHCEIFSLSSWNQDLWMHQSAVGVCYYVWPCHFLAKVLRCSQWCTHNSLSHSHIRYTKVQLESATMSDHAIFWPRFSDAANGAPIEVIF